MQNLHQLSLKIDNTTKLVNSLKLQSKSTSNTSISSEIDQNLCDEYFPIGNANKTIEKIENKLNRKKFALNVVSCIYSE